MIKKLCKETQEQRARSAHKEKTHTHAKKDSVRTERRHIHKDNKHTKRTYAKREIAQYNTHTQRERQ